MTQRAVPAGTSVLGRFNHAGLVEDRGQTKNSPWSSRVGVGRRADNPLFENIKHITETETRITTAPYWEAGV